MKNFKIKLFADGANIEYIKRMYNEKQVNGFTTNPTLMKKDGVTCYRTFLKEVSREITDLPVSFEVLSDELDIMEEEARFISSLGSNIYVKIPITNSKGKSTIPIIKKLSSEGIQVNVTAILTIKQVSSAYEALSVDVKSIISVFAGRIADTGRDPMIYMKEAANIIKNKSSIELLWASPRELYNIFQAEECGCHIIALTDSILNKLPMVNKDLTELSQETVLMFYNDTNSVGYFLLTDKDLSNV